MMSPKRGLLLCVCVVLTALTVMLAASGQNRPGDIAQARVWIENRDAGDAIPVVVQRAAEPLRVQVAGTPTVVLDASSVTPTRVARQPWEYRTLKVQAGQDPAAALASAGVEGWEAIGVLAPDQAGGAVLLKRPR